MIIKEPFIEYRKRGKFYSPSDYKNANNVTEVKCNRYTSKPSTPDMTFGRLVHTVMLEPEMLATEYVIDKPENYPIPKLNDKGKINLRFQSNKDYRDRQIGNATLADKEVVSARLLDKANDMKKAWEKTEMKFNYKFLNHADALIETSFYGIATFDRNGIFDGFKELPSMDYVKADNELLVKTRPDYVLPDTYYLDVKTSASANPKIFAADCANYGYDIQAAFITDFVNFLLGAEVKNFLFIVMEKNEPYLSVPMIAPESMIESGRARYQTRLEKIFKDVDNGYLMYAESEENPIVSIPYPNWAKVNKNQSLVW